MRKEFGHCALLDNPPLVHNGDGLGYFLHHGQVMGDQQHRHAVFRLDIADQVENLVLDGNVQSGGRFVGDQQLRPAGQGHGDNHPLALAAGQLVGVAVDPVLGLVDSGPNQ